ncbi:MAG: class I SAM-dependent methyltransferase [Clostridia bacterium]|nr:class I SAM-dependent methyltransferase [Clostridia bacterium]
MLKARLQKISNLVRGGAVLCDIGTDHADLVVDLLKRDKIKFAYACDLREKPLQNAKMNLENAGLYGKFSCILSDGFENLKDKEDITDIVISGLGGETIIDILKDCPFLNKSNINFILSPQSKAEKLRAFLNENKHQFTEDTEDDSGKKYLIIVSKYSGKKENLDLKREFFGTTNDLQYKKSVYNMIQKRLKNKDYEKDRREELINLLKEVKNDYS